MLHNSLQSRPPVSKNKFIPPQDLNSKSLPPIPETDRVTDLEDKNYALTEENRSLKAQIDIHARQISKLNEIFSEGDSGPASLTLP